MAINIILLLIFMVCLAYLAMGVRRMETDVSSNRRDLDRLNREQAELTGAIDTLQDMFAAENERLTAAVAELEGLTARKEEAEVQLQAVQDAPKQRLFVFDKTTLVHGKLWEVTVANSLMAGADQGNPAATEWAAGRICLVGSATDRDARHRTESRFPSSQGYRIMTVERFRRG